MAFTLPPLPYAYDALEPVIDKETVGFHHDKHHAAYVTNLNNAVARRPTANMGLEEIVCNLDTVPEEIRTAVRNNAGGHLNHVMYWEIMTPGGAKEPCGALADAIKGTFGDVEKFKKAFEEGGMKRFGSGWVWLQKSKQGKLEIVSTPLHDNPLMEGAQPIMVNDVWEHAYYLKYQNRRGDYLAAWWNLVNWDKIAEIFGKLK